MRSRLTKKIAVAAVACVVFTGLVATGAAYADTLTLSVAPDTGLTDGQQIHVHMTGINAIPLAVIQLSECGNAYADNTPLTSLNPTTDCSLVDRIDVSNAPTLDVDENVFQTGLGTGNRSCILSGNFSCEIRVTSTVNQMSAPPPPVPISFAADVEDATSTATTTTASVRGAPAIVGGPVYVEVAVTTANSSLRPQGNVTVDIDGNAGVASGTLGSDGTVIVQAPAQLHGTHQIVAHYQGDGGSFAPSDSSSTPFDVINADNVSIGDVSVVEGNSGLRKIYFPVVLSQVYRGAAVQIQWTFRAGSADLGDVSTPTTGRVTFLAGSTTAVVNYVHPNVIGDTNVEPDQHFYIDLSLVPIKSRDFKIRRGTGTGTIINDDASATPTVNIGDASTQEGDGSGGHYIKLPLTLSDPDPFEKVFVTVQLSSTNAVHLGRAKGGDWMGTVTRTIKFLPNTVRMNVGILEYPDLKDEPDLTIRAQILSVSSPIVGFSIGRGSGLGTILSDE